MENLCLHILYKQGILTQGKNAILLFCSSLTFGIAFLFSRRDGNDADDRSDGKSLPAWAAPALLTAAMIGMAFPYASFLASHRLGPDISDVIPLIQVACRRLLAGEYPYSVVTEFGWDENMTYLPMHWMPMTIAQLLHIDPRWIPFGIWSITAILLSYRTAKTTGRVMQIGGSLLFFSTWLMIFIFNSGFFEATVELMMAAYYMIFVVSLNTKNPWWQGAIIGICLVSRYSLVLWLPLYAFVLLLEGSRRQLLVTVAVSVGVVLALYVLPFMTRDPHLFTDGYHYYDKAALFEWTHLNNDGKPSNLFAGTGFAYFFYTRFTGIPVEQRIALLQKTHLFASIGVCVVMGVWYYLKRKTLDYRIFLMGSFKIYFAVFLFFIQVPYEYLMSVGNFVSVALFCELMRKPGKVTTSLQVTS
ncbi:MAG: hypothetical protein KF744_17025 [Taibaiella sp.]|nr:hypothetical protein [Taibaiella sp.]